MRTSTPTTLNRTVPADWQRTLDRFREKGLTNAEIADAMRRANDHHPRDPWRYACAIMWDMLDEKTHISHINPFPRS